MKHIFINSRILPAGFREADCSAYSIGEEVRILWRTSEGFQGRVVAVKRVILDSPHEKRGFIDIL